MRKTSRRNPSDKEHIKELLSEGFLPLKRAESEGGFDYEDDDPVFIAVAYEAVGYGPHAAVMYVDQNRYHASQDSALQAADELLEQYQRDYEQDEWNEIFHERAAEALKIEYKTLKRKSFDDIKEMIEDAGEDFDSVLTETDEWFRENNNFMVWGPISPEEAYEILSEAHDGEWLKHGIHVWNSPDGDIG